MRLYITWVILLFWSAVCAQRPSAALEISVPDSVVYSLYLRGELIGAERTADFMADSIAHGHYLIDLLVQGKPMTHVRTELAIDSGQTAKLSLIADPALGYRLERHDQPPTVDYTRPAGQAEQNLNIEITQLNYSTCAPPLSRRSFDAIVERVQGMAFERDKYLHLKQFIGSTCLSTAQIRTLIELIDDDERRLSLLIKAGGACFDASALIDLEDVLYLSRHKERFKLIYGP
jgi:hypothetical protein